MFTGIIQDVGEVVLSEGNPTESLALTLTTMLPTDRFALGCSIACNGVCLTVTEFSAETLGTRFRVEVGPETLACTTLAQLKVDSRVNLELALRVGDSLGGHEVTGHVDDLAVVAGLEPWGEGFMRFSLALTPAQAKWIIPKGSIAVKGTSLTIAQIHTAPHPVTGGPVIDIMVIPHTLSRTVLGECTVGSRVEVEFDRSVKAVASLLEHLLPAFLPKNTI